MTTDEWANLAASISQVWPAGRLDDETITTWYGLLEDLEGGHVAMALQELGKTTKFQPTIAEIRAEAARQEVRMRPALPPANDPEQPGNPLLSFTQWRDLGYPGCEEWGLTPADCDRVTRGGAWQQVRQVADR